MSLLIKALDHLEKNKEAEKGKKQTGEYVADEALTLELMPVESKEPDVAVSQEAEPVGAKVAAKPDIANIQAESNRNLSLEEEAGITRAAYVAKPSGKAAQVSKPAKNSQENPQISSAKTKASSSKTTSTFQVVNDELNQKAAAKVFAANKEVKTPSSKFALIGLGVVGAVLVLLGLQGYDYIKKLATPNEVIVKPNIPVQSLTVQAQALPMTSSVGASNKVAPPAESKNASDTEMAQKDHANVAMNDDAKIASVTSSSVFKNKKIEKQSAGLVARHQKTDANDEVNFDVVDANSSEHFNEQRSSENKQKSITLISKTQSQGVDPTLIAAYQAFTRGEDANAQQQYRQVLKNDVRNVDALLGMAAIAQRQGREADALGWYQKVLEIDPRNTIAQTAMVTPQANTDAVGTESRIKSMIAQQPDGANLHAALGNLYAEQNQWPAAQEAYFNASRLAPNNADYAFNLAISLDQMGKSSLALKQYQRALELLIKSGGSSPDRAALEARIRELQ